MENKDKPFWKTWTWMPSEKELKAQSEDYDKLTIIHSYRGISALLLVLTAIITTISSSLFDIDFVSALVAALVFQLPLAWLVYRGYEWALVVAMIYWTFEKVFSIWTGGNLLNFLWWGLYIKYFYAALIVERYREKTK